jgi:shikimate dehydrogenase
MCGNILSQLFRNIEGGFGMKKIYLLGHPVKQSMSVSILNPIFERRGMDLRYELLDVKPEELGKVVTDLLKDENCLAFNITVPHKENVIEYLKDISDDAKDIGAVNCVDAKTGKGYNTDWKGFKESVENFGVENVATVFGAGGASKAIVYALCVLGFKEIRVVNRTVERAEKLVERFSELFKDKTFKIHSLKESSKALSGADWLVNTTSVGMYPNVDECIPVDEEEIRKLKLVYDVVHNPKITKLLSIAQKVGVNFVSGTEMWINQAKENFKIWNVEEITDEFEEKARELIG